MKRSNKRSNKNVTKEEEKSTANGNVTSAKVKPQKEDNQSEDEFEVDQIVDMQVYPKRKCPISFRVRWVGYGESDDTWLRFTELSCETLITDFLEVSGRKSEYEKALSAMKETTATDRCTRDKRERKDYVDESEDELLPHGTKSRSVKKMKKALSSSSKKLKTVKNKTSEPEEEYEVESLVDKRVYQGNVQFKIHWKGYASKHDSWVNKTDLNCKSLIDKYDDEPENEVEQEWKVEMVMKMRIKTGKKEYLIHWKGYDSKSDSWEPEENVSGCKQLAEFLQNQESDEEEETSKNPVNRRSRGRKSAGSKS